MKKSFFCLIFLLATISPGFSQQPPSIQITGTLLDKETLDPLQFASVVVTSSYHGTITSSTGLFTLLVHPGDTVKFSILGYKSTEMVIPYGMKESRYGLLELMEKSTILLKEVNVYPWPTPSQFNSAFLDVKLPPTEEEKTNQMQKELETTIRETYESQKYYDEQWKNRHIYELTGQIPANRFLDPGRWQDFIIGLKKNKK